MSVRIGVVMDPISSITYKKDATMAMLWAASDRGWELFYMEQEDMYLRDGARASVRPLTVFRDPQHWFKLGDTSDISMTELDVVLMRKDPPFDQAFLYSTHILEQAAREGVMVVNDPRSLRDCNEKLFATQFPQCCPPLIVSADQARLKGFWEEHKDVVFKPLDAMGGAMIFRVRENDPNVNVILETLTEHGRVMTMGQRYLPEIVDGDKRILMINGEPVPYCLARLPARGESRGNLAAGGTGEARPLTDRDRWIASQVGPALRERGLLFVGLDVIGDYLTEINVTSPTCIREIDAAFDTNIGAMLMDCIEDKLKQR